MFHKKNYIKLLLLYQVDWLDVMKYWIPAEFNSIEDNVCLSDLHVLVSPNCPRLVFFIHAIFIPRIKIVEYLWNI